LQLPIETGARSKLTVLTLLSELGLDPSRFPSAKHFASWLGLCPGSRITGGKRKSSKTRPVVNRVANALRMAAQTLVRSQSALGAFYRRMKARMGAPKAITATAHKLARIFYHFWKSGGSYRDPGIGAYERQQQERAVKNLQKKALALGFDLIAKPPSPECVS
jgi:transposase